MVIKSVYKLLTFVVQNSLEEYVLEYKSAMLTLVTVSNTATIVD